MHKTPNQGENVQKHTTKGKTFEDFYTSTILTFFKFFIHKTTNQGENVQKHTTQGKTFEDFYTPTILTFF